MDANTTTIEAEKSGADNCPESQSCLSWGAISDLCLG